MYRKNYYTRIHVDVRVRQVSYNQRIQVWFHLDGELLRKRQINKHQLTQVEFIYVYSIQLLRHCCYLIYLYVPAHLLRRLKYNQRANVYVKAKRKTDHININLFKKRPLDQSCMTFYSCELSDRAFSVFSLFVYNFLTYFGHIKIHGQ